MKKLIENIKARVGAYFATPSLCRRFDKRVSGYVDGILAQKDKDFVIQHKKTCKRCRQEFNAYKKMTKLLSSANLNVPLPTNFADELHAKLVQSAEDRVQGVEDVARVKFTDFTESLARLWRDISESKFYGDLRDGISVLGRPRVYAPALAAVLIVSVFAAGAYRNSVERLNFEDESGKLNRAVDVLDEIPEVSAAPSVAPSVSPAPQSSLAPSASPEVKPSAAPSVESVPEEVEFVQMMMDAGVLDDDSASSLAGGGAEMTLSALEPEPTSAPAPPIPAASRVMAEPDAAEVADSVTAAPETAEEGVSVWVVRANDVAAALENTGFASRAITDGGKKVLILTKAEYNQIISKAYFLTECEVGFGGVRAVQAAYEKPGCFRLEIVPK